MNEEDNKKKSRWTRGNITPEDERLEIIMDKSFPDVFTHDPDGSAVWIDVSHDGSHCRR